MWKRFQPGEGPSRGLLRDCTTSPINRLSTALVTTACNTIAEGRGCGCSLPRSLLSFVPNIRHTTSELRKKNRDQRPIYRMGFQSFQCLNWTELNWEQCLMSSEFELELWQLLWVFKWKLPSRKESSTLRFFNQLFWGMSWQRQDGISWGGGCLTLINRNISPSIEIYLSAYLKIYLSI